MNESVLLVDDTDAAFERPARRSNAEAAIVAAWVGDLMKASGPGSP
jgi:hypothetical protein